MNLRIGLTAILGLLLYGNVEAASRDTLELALLSKRRIAELAELPDPTWFAKIQSWIDSQNEDGTWQDVNYLSGCAAQRANWPIQEHWNRIITLAAAWSGSSAVSQKKWINNGKVWQAISSGLDYWFENDYEPAECMGNGGDIGGDCPCGTPGLWNQNWYDQAILIPQLSSTACILVKGTNLTETQRQGCIRIPQRTYYNIDGSYGNGGNLTAANIVLVLQSAVNLGLFTDNVTIVEDSFSRAFNVMTFSDKPMQDGMHRDGSFLQHNGILYNGNYGKDLLNIFIQFEGEARGTRFAAGNETREAMSTYIRGDEWMIFTEKETRRQHWDYNVVGRFVSYPSQDLQANADINFNVTKLDKAVADFDGPYSLGKTMERLASNGSKPLVGNKGFWASDYMVHRRNSFILANKMLSTRSTNSELVNGANLLGYHLGQGTLFTYVDGTEYKDIWASWDWNLIPGTTVVLDEPLITSTKVNYTGKRDFVGVVSDGAVGAAVEDYLDPFDGHLSYRKSWFYMDDAVVVTTMDFKTANNAGEPVITVLENRAQAPGGAWIDNKRVQLDNNTKAQGSSLYYGGNGYVSHGKPFELTLFEGERTGNWSAISTSKAGEVTTSVFSAYFSHGDAAGGDSSSYAVLPSTSPARLAQEAQWPSWKTVAQGGISGAWGQDTLALAFWPDADVMMTTIDLADVGWASRGSVTVKSRQPGLYLFTSRCRKPGRGFRLLVTVADPTQKLVAAGLELEFDQATIRTTKRSEEATGISVSKQSVVFELELPQGGLAGSSVRQELLVLTD